MDERCRLVTVIDDDVSVRESLPELLRELGFAAEAFASAEDFLASDRVATAQCLLLDVAMPGLGGAGLQQELATRRMSVPIVFITASSDGALADRLRRSGAVDCLRKPFDVDLLRAALNRAFEARAQTAP